MTNQCQSFIFLTSIKPISMKSYISFPHFIFSLHRWCCTRTSQAMTFTVFSMRRFPLFLIHGMGLFFSLYMWWRRWSLSLRLSSIHHQKRLIFAPTSEVQSIRRNGYISPHTCTVPPWMMLRCHQKKVFFFGVELIWNVIWRLLQLRLGMPFGPMGVGQLFGVLFVGVCPAQHGDQRQWTSLQIILTETYAYIMVQINFRA